MAMRLAVIAALLLSALGAVPAAADDDDDARDELYEARKRGDILPLDRILKRIDPAIGRHIVDIEVEREDGRVIYEIYYLDRRGRRRQIHVDAGSGSILREKEDD